MPASPFPSPLDPLPVRRHDNGAATRVRCQICLIFWAALYLTSPLFPIFHYPSLSRAPSADIVHLATHCQITCPTPMGGATPKAKFNFNYNIFCCDFSPKSILLTNFLFTICLCAGMYTHTNTHTHTYIDTLLYTYRYACIYRVYFNQPRPDTTVSPGPDWAALGRTTKQLQIVFSLPPAPTDPYPLPAPFTCVGSIHARIYLFTRCCPRPRRIFNFSLANWKSSNAKYRGRARCRKQHRNGDWPIPKSSI